MLAGSSLVSGKWLVDEATAVVKEAAGKTAEAVAKAIRDR
jgi:hypothetical protein